MSQKSRWKSQDPMLCHFSRKYFHGEFLHSKTGAVVIVLPVLRKAVYLWMAFCLRCKQIAIGMCRPMEQWKPG